MAQKLKHNITGAVIQLHKRWQNIKMPSDADRPVTHLFPRVRWSQVQALSVDAKVASATRHRLLSSCGQQMRSSLTELSNQSGSFDCSGHRAVTNTKPRPFNENQIKTVLTCRKCETYHLQNNHMTPRSIDIVLITYLSMVCFICHPRKTHLIAL